MKTMKEKEFYETYGDAKVSFAYKVGRTFLVFKNSELGITVTVKDDSGMLELIRKQQDAMDKLFDYKYTYKRVAVVEYSVKWIRPYLAKLNGEVIFGSPAVVKKTYKRKDISLWKRLLPKTEMFREERYCHYCGKPVDGPQVDFCRHSDCRKKFFGWVSNTPSELDAEVSIYSNKKGGLNHAYLESV